MARYATRKDYHHAKAETIRRRQIRSFKYATHDLELSTTYYSREN